MTAESQSWLFGSFFLGGFECSTHLTVEGRRLDMAAATQHDVQAAQDYTLCRQIGLRAVREAARWPMADRGGRLLLDDVRRLARLGCEAGLTQIWDLMHYGYPDDLEPYSDKFVERFAAFARAVAAVVREETAGPTYYTPINEISYNAWAAGEVGYMAPFGKGQGGALKRALVRASIAGANAIWEADPEAIMVNVDPLVRLHAPKERPDLQPQADAFNHSVVTESFDLLCGLREPELGGSRNHLGIVGFNYYRTNQWTISTPALPQRFLEPGAPDWVALSEMLLELQGRYGGPLLLAETGASGRERPGWIEHLAGEARRARLAGVDLQGICLYPVVTSPDWEDPTAFFDGGVFDLAPQPDGTLKRALSVPTAEALRQAQAELDPDNVPSESLQAAEAPCMPPPLQIVQALDRARFKSDNFSYQTLLAGETLLVELLCFEPGGLLPAHRHEATEHVWTVLEGEGELKIEERTSRLRQGDAVILPAGLYHGLTNDSATRLVVQQVSSPKPWDARFGGPHPAHTTDQRLSND